MHEHARAICTIFRQSSVGNIVKVEYLKYPHENGLSAHLYKHIHRIAMHD